MRIVVAVLLFFSIVVQGVLLPWSTNRQHNSLINNNNILQNIGHKISRIFLPWRNGVRRRNSMEERR